MRRRLPVLVAAAALSVVVAACDNEAPPSAPGESVGASTTCIDCHSSEAALKASLAAVTSGPVATYSVAGDG